MTYKEHEQAARAAGFNGLANAIAKVGPVYYPQAKRLQNISTERLERQISVSQTHKQHER